MQLLLALLIAVSPDARQDADRIAAQAKAHREAGSFKVALEEAQRAFIIYPKSAYLLEIALDQSALGKWTEAARVYQRYLTTKPKGENKQLAEKGLAEAQAHQSGDADPLAIAPLTPAPAPAPEAEPLATAAPLTPASTAFEAQLAPPPLVELPAVSEPAPKAHSRVLAYTLIGVGAVAAVFAVIGWVEVANYNSYVGGLKLGGPGSTGQNALSQQSAANTWWDVGLTTTIVAGLAGGGAAFTW